MMTRSNPAGRGRLLPLPSILPLLLAAVAAQAPAQTLTGVRVAPANVKVGEPVRITVDFDVQEQKINCGIRLHFGDGFHEDYKINQPSDVPLGVSRSYARAGSFQISVEPQTVRGVLKCLGKPARATVNVAAAAAASAPAAAVAPPPASVVSSAPRAAAPAPTAKPAASAPAAKPAASAAVAKAPAPECPTGFKLDAKSHSTKTGAYTCKAPAGTAMPSGKLACGPKLAYFESPKTVSVGCRAE